MLFISLASDFNSTMQVVIIAAGTNNSEVNISVTNDNIVEGNETFNMNLSVPSVPSLLSPEITIGTITSATVTIIDISSELNHYVIIEIW